MTKPIYKETTDGITVNVLPVYLEEQSDPESMRYIWAYSVQIDNGTDAPVTLRSRHWRIIDAYGKIEEVHGEGVVGEQPLIAPGESFSYTSGAPLPTPSGFMSGSYDMERQDGQHIAVTIPTFALDTPETLRTIH